MSAAWCGIRRACISYIRIDVFLANVNNSHWDVTQLFRLLARLMHRIAPLRNEILMCSRQSTLLAISLMKDYLFIRAQLCITSASLAGVFLLVKCQRIVCRWTASDKKWRMRASCLSEIFNLRTTRNDRVSERIIQFSNTVLYFSLLSTLKDKLF